MKAGGDEELQGISQAGWRAFTQGFIQAQHANMHRREISRITWHVIYRATILTSELTFVILMPMEQCSRLRAPGLPVFDSVAGRVCDTRYGA
jgi:hypothetical protein